MEYIKKIKKMLCNELDEYAMKGKLTMADLEAVHKLSDTIKNLDKIMMLEEDGEGGMSYDNDMMYSERRGRGRYARRDSMGRYSSDGEYQHEYGTHARAGHGLRGGYSRDDAKDHLLNKMGEMMTSADEEQREILKDAMRKIEKA